LLFYLAILFNDLILSQRLVGKFGARNYVIEELILTVGAQHD